MTALRQLAAHLRKDLLLEFRSRDAIIGMIFFALLVVVIFSLAFDPTMAQSRAISGGILWVALLFAAVIALNQAWARETRHNVLDALRMSPASPALLFLAKALVNFLFVTVLELILAPLFIVFYNLHTLGESWKLLFILPLGTWALVTNGTFFAALSLRTRNRELILLLVLFPLSIPALLGAVLATTAVFTGQDSPDLWIRLLVVFDVIFTTAGLLLFDVVLSAE
jgi:heme exporter protein B